MKNYAMPLAIAVVGLGLMSIGFNLDGNTATATTGVFNAGPEEPTIVWYDTASVETNSFTQFIMVYRAWSDGTIEAKAHGDGYLGYENCQDFSDNCSSDWFVISSPNEGLNAQADINFDSQVNAEDLGIMLAAWGDAPRNDYPPSDCPLGLIP